MLIIVAVHQGALRCIAIPLLYHTLQHTHFHTYESSLLGQLYMCEHLSVATE
jgi:hypothetical protein